MMTLLAQMLLVDGITTCECGHPFAAHINGRTCRHCDCEEYHAGSIKTA